MSGSEPVEGPFSDHEAFDPVELATEAEASELAEERASDEAAEAAAAAEAAGAPAPEAAPAQELPAADAGSGLLQRALKAAGSDAARYIPVRFVPALTSLVTTPLFTRAIAPADYGAFAQVSMVCSLLAAASVGWLQSSLIRFYWPAKKEGRLNEYVSTVVWTGITSLVAASIVTLIAVYFAQGSMQEAVLRLVPVGIVYFIANFYTTAIIQILRSAKRASAYSRLMIWTTVLVTGFSVAFVWFGKWGSLGILAGAALGNLIVAPFILGEISKEGSLSPRYVDRSMFDELMRFGLPLVPSAMAGWALVVLDRFVIQFYHGLAQVGLYSVAYTLGDKIMQLATMPLILTMMPSLIESYEKHGQALAERVQTQFTRYFAILTFPLLLGMAASARVFMRVFTHGQYETAYAVLALVSAGSLAGSFAQIAGAGLGMHKKTKLIMADALIAAAVNLALNIALVPRFGYIAAAWNTLAAYACLLGLTWFQSRKYMRWIIPWFELGRITIASLGMASVVWGISKAVPVGTSSIQAAVVLAIQVVVGIALYAALMFALRGFRREEREFVGGIVRRGFARRDGGR